MNLSYKEKTLIASIITTIIFFGSYLYIGFKNLTNWSTKFGQLFALIILFIVFEIIIKSALKLGDKLSIEDERDKLIELTSYKYSYWTLTAAIWFVIFQLLLNTPFSKFFNTPQGLFYSLVLFVILAELISFISQLYLSLKGK
jgi:hypothetical protein